MENEQNNEKEGWPPSNYPIFLSLAFLILLIYGLMIDWWSVEGYFTNFVLVILGVFTMYFFTKQLAGRMGGK
ncbi:MAG: hypothetical protein KKG76_08105 [Euryarchaeota archaeon]|nr:hypothetical protein [Euryarchaeota archaeon]